MKNLDNLFRMNLQMFAAEAAESTETTETAQSEQNTAAETPKT